MSLDSIKIPGEIISVEGTGKQLNKIFLFTISTCLWCKKGKNWLKEHGFHYSYLDIDKIPIEEKNTLKKDIEEVFGVKPRFPFLIVNKMQWDSGFNPNIWEDMLR
ncbi:MAG: glutaredoxin family protein [Promethearchaeota archaeon]